MLKLRNAPILLAVPLAVASASAHAAVFGPDAGVCELGGEPAVLVTVTGFKSRTGKVRVQLYGSNASDFLAKGKWLKRVDLPVTAKGPMPVCVALPGPGRYAVAVRHDINGDGKSSWDDGGGFSRNPDISLFHLKPDYQSVVVTVGQGVLPLEVVLNYRHGLTISPINGEG